MAYNGYGGYISSPYLNTGARCYQPQYSPSVQQPYMAQQQMAQPQPMQQQIQQPIQQPVQQPQVELPFSEIRYLNADQIKGFVVYPNTKVMLIDRDNKRVHIVTADGMGITTSQVYRYEPFVEPQQIETPQKPVEIDTSMFIQTKDFESFVDNITKKLEKLEKEVKVNAILKEEDK